MPVDESVDADAIPGKIELWNDDDPAKMKTRPPVVTILGHVDHGKTSLLDAIRSANVDLARGRRHHAAHRRVPDRAQRSQDHVPGHAGPRGVHGDARTRRERHRRRVLVVAADDGVMPQTIEAISHVKAAGVPIVVALNKIDKADANTDQVKAQLAEHGVTIEEYGGDTPLVAVSARTKQGIPELLEVVMLVAEVAELKADPDRPAIGRVIEAHMDARRGSVATILVQTGTLSRGDLVVAGLAYGRVRAMTDDKGKNVGRAEPSRPVEIPRPAERPRGRRRLPRRA